MKPLKHLFLEPLEEEFELFKAPQPQVIQTAITEAKNRVRKGYFETITEFFKWSPKIKRKFRADINVDELNDPLKLYGQWTQVKKETAGYTLFVELHIEHEVEKGAIYINEARQLFIATGPHSIEARANFKKRKDVVVYRAGEFLTLIKYANP